MACAPPALMIKSAPAKSAAAIILGMNKKNIVKGINKLIAVKGRLDIAVLNDIILNGRKHKRVNIIAQHCRDQPPITKGGFTYYPMPTARDFAGGQVWFRMGFMMLGLWRPPTHIEFNGVMYDPNTLMVDVQKQKPNGISTPGFYETKALLYYEPKTHRYYEQLGTSTSYAKKRREEPENQEPPQMVL